MALALAAGCTAADFGAVLLTQPVTALNASAATISLNFILFP